MKTVIMTLALLVSTSNAFARIPSSLDMRDPQLNANAEAATAKSAPCPYLTGGTLLSYGRGNGADAAGAKTAVRTAIK